MWTRQIEKLTFKFIHTHNINDVVDGVQLFQFKIRPTNKQLQKDKNGKRIRSII